MGEKSWILMKEDFCFELETLDIIEIAVDELTLATRILDLVSEVILDIEEIQEEGLQLH